MYSCIVTLTTNHGLGITVLKTCEKMQIHHERVLEIGGYFGIYLQLHLFTEMVSIFFLRFLGNDIHLFLPV